MPTLDRWEQDQLALDRPTEIVVPPTLGVVGCRENFRLAPPFTPGTSENGGFLGDGLDAHVVSRVGGPELAGAPIALGLLLVTRPAAPLEVGQGGGAARDVGLDVIVLGVESVAAVHAANPVEFGGLSQLQGQKDLDLGAAGPAADVPEVLAVVEEAGQERIGGDLPGDLGCDGTDPGDLAELSLSHVLPTPRGDLVGDQHDELGAAGAALALAGQQRRVGIREVALEGLSAAVPFRTAIEPRGLGLSRLTIGDPTWGSQARWTWTMPRSSR
jgi:hypothetical protein